MEIVKHSFKEIDFGYTDAATEFAENPKLLLDGYVDIDQVTDAAKTGRQFLFLGYKGAGKSAIGQRVKILSQTSYQDFVRLIELGEFPFRPFSKIIKGDSDHATKMPTAWSWILLPYILELLNRDYGITGQSKERLAETVKAFESMGFCATDRPARLVTKSSKNAFQVTSPEFFGLQGKWSHEQAQSLPATAIPDYVESIKKFISKEIKTESNHYLIIDGLDDIIINDGIQYESLGSLIKESRLLNQLFRENQINIKIIILCRTDLFEKFSGANKNKIRQDYAAELDWYSDPREPKSSLLVRAANQRARIAFGEEVDIFDEFFPREISRKNALSFLLDMTRHTPRDFFQLLKSIQKHTSGLRPTDDEIKSGLRKYSIEYFLPEIKDELSGYVPEKDIETLFEIFGELRKRDIHVGELLSNSVSKINGVNREKIISYVKIMFNCSAVGNIQNKPGGNTFYSFKYRNRHASFNEAEGIMLHKGLWKALNLV